MRERYKENLMTRVALYARYSSNNQSVSSIEGQFRISRDQADVATLYKHFKFAGVTLAEGEISELHVGLKGTMNALFLKDLAAKTHRGLRGLVEKGKAGGGFCYGYDVVKRLNGDGEQVRGKRKINAAEAGIVRRIFREFAAGKSPKAIGTF